MARKYRSAFNFATQYTADKAGYGVGTENYLHIREETTPGTYLTPRIPTSGSSISDATPSTDISGGTDSNFKISVDGGAVLTIDLSPLAGLNTGNLIAAAIETETNTALSAAGQDGRVSVLFEGGLYKIYSQKAGPSTSIVVTDATSNNVADDLKIGLLNGGLEVAGTATQDYLWMTKCSFGLTQPTNPSMHRAGRQISSFLKSKKVVEGDLEMYVNFDETGANPSIDTAVKCLFQQIFGYMDDQVSQIKFNSSQPQTKSFSVIQANNMFNFAANGMFGKNFTLTLPGDGVATLKVSCKGRDAKSCSIAKIVGPVAGLTDLPVTSGEEEGFETGARVMVIDLDGRTILSGADGTLTATGINTTTHKVSVSAAQTLAGNGYLVPWMPHVLGFDGLIDNPVVGLEGTVSFDGGSTTIEEITNVEFSMDPKTEDHDNFYGADGNRGYAVADRQDLKLSVTMKMSASQFKKIQQTKNFETFAMVVKLGNPSGRHMKLTCPRVLFTIPKVEIPDSGVVTVTFEGLCMQSSAGAHDAFEILFL